MIIIKSVSWAKGFADGCNGLGALSTNSDYVAGWVQSRPFALKRKLDNGKGQSAMGFSVGSDCTEDRQQTIINQVRGAACKEAYKQAMQAAYMYDLTLWQSLDKVYAGRWN